MYFLTPQNYKIIQYEKPGATAMGQRPVGGIVETRRAASLFLAAGQHVVQTTETDVVSPTVTTEDPLALLHQVILQVNDLLAVVATALFASGDNLVGQLSGLDTVLAVVDPLLEQSFLVAALAEKQVCVIESRLIFNKFL